MSVQVLGSTVRRAAKNHRCQMCDAAIRPGQHHQVTSCVYDGRAYDWRECLACSRDRVITWAHDWAGWPEEGVDFDTVREWADEALWRSRRPRERRAARAWLARAAGGEGE